MIVGARRLSHRWPRRHLLRLLPTIRDPSCTPNIGRPFSELILCYDLLQMYWVGLPFAKIRERLLESRILGLVNGNLIRHGLPKMRFEFT